jgi:polynucleotide 5'-kinase involved in rRNA processing
MARTLLVGTVKHSWREYIREYRKKRDLLVLDPADAHFGTPGRFTLFRGDRVVDWSFFGAIDPAKNPIELLAAAHRLLQQAERELVVMSFDFKAAPVMRQLSLAVANMVDPDEILVPDGAHLAGEPWPIGAEQVVLESDFPDMVLNAQRRARWLELLEKCEDHEIPMDDVHFLNTRFGGGKRLPADYFERAGIQGILWAEVAARTLLVVARKPLSDDEVGNALNVAHATKFVLVDPISFSGLLCSFARQSGEELGMGMIEEASFTRGVFKVRCTAVNPAPVRILKVGLLRIDTSGREIEENRPWSL